MFLKTTISSFFLVRVRSGIDDKFINYDNYSDDVTYDAVDAIVEVLGRLREKNKEWEGQLTFQNIPLPKKKKKKSVDPKARTTSIDNSHCITTKERKMIIVEFVNYSEDNLLVVNYIFRYKEDTTIHEIELEIASVFSLEEGVFHEIDKIR